jgi:hypothetical protein
MSQHVSKHAAARRKTGPRSPVSRDASLNASDVSPNASDSDLKPSARAGSHARRQQRRNRLPNLAATVVAVTAVSTAVVAGPELAQRADGAHEINGKGLVAAGETAERPKRQPKSTVKPPRKDLKAPRNSAVSGDDSVKLTRSTMRELAAKKASRSRARLALSGDPKKIAASLLPSFGFSQDQMQCLIPMWFRESGWNLHATNRSSGAYGIPQALPGSKMAKFGSDWQTNAATQIKWGLWYVKSRYGSPCGAWSSWQRNSWY